MLPRKAKQTPYMRGRATSDIAQVSHVHIPGVGAVAGCDCAERHSSLFRKEPASEIQQPAFSVGNEFGREKEVIEAARPIGDGPVQREMV